MKRYLQPFIASALLVMGLFGVFTLVPAQVSALNCNPGDPNTSIADGAACAKSRSQPTTLFEGNTSVFNRITSILLFVVGAIAVIMLIIGGIRYVVSGGQKEKVTNAKNTILYALVGLLIAIFANAIIQFILGAALGTGNTTNI